MWKLKSLSIVLLVGLLGTARADNIIVTVNGNRVEFEGTQPHQINGRVLIPLRGVLEQMGATVDWLQQEQTVVATRNNMEISLPLGSRYATVNGRRVALDVPAMTIAGSTMVPLRFVGEALGANVMWSDDTQTVSIDTDQNYRAYRRPRPIERRPIERRPNLVRTTLTANSVIPVRLDNTLRSNENVAGDRFEVSVESGPDDCGLPQGTKFEGIVREAIPARNGRPGVLDVDFDRIIFPDGDRQAIDASLTSLDNKYTARNDSGRLIGKSRNNNERLKWVGIGAGAGLLIGTLTHGNALVDTLFGAGAGYLFNELQRKGAGNVSLRSGTEMGVRIDQRFAFDRETK